MEPAASDITELSDKLKPFAGKIEAWRKRAAEIRALADEAIARRTIEPDTLVEIEQTGTDIRTEIAAFDKLVSAIGAISPASAAQLGGIGDALRLVLLEITELGTRMYAVRWQAVFDTAESENEPGGEPVHHVAPDEVIYLGGPVGDEPATEDGPTPAARPAPSGAEPPEDAGPHP